MSSSFNVPDRFFLERGPMFGLPPGGFGNGLPAKSWALIADVAEDDLAEVLLSLTDARIPAYVAVQTRRPRGRLKRSARYGLWVDSMNYGRAEDLLMTLFNRLEHRAERQNGGH